MVFMGPESRSSPVLPIGADDFQRIKGIGPNIARRLHAADILTFAQLAGLSPNDIAQTLGNPQLWPVERIVRENWVGQARELATLAQGIESQVDLVAQQDRKHYATFTVRLFLDEDKNVHHTEVVSIQDGHSDRWAGWEGSRLLRFLVEQAPLRLLGPQVRSPGPKAISDVDEQALITENSREGTTKPLPVKTGEEKAETAPQLNIYQFSIGETSPEEWLLGQALAEHLYAHIGFQLIGELADEASHEELSFVVQILAHELMTDQTMVLATVRKDLHSAKGDFATSVEFAKPKVGRYLIIGKVLVSDTDLVGLCLGPIIRVVPP